MGLVQSHLNSHVVDHHDGAGQRCTVRTALHAVLACLGLPAGPHHVVESEIRAQQVGLSADHHLALGGVHVDDETLGLGLVQAETAALSDGDHLDGVDRTDIVPFGVDHPRRMERNAMAEEGLATTGGGDEADVLAVGFRCRAQAELPRHIAHLILGHVADGKERALEFATSQHVHHVALVLGRIVAAEHAGSARRRERDARVVTRCHGVETECIRALRET